MHLNFPRFFKKTLGFTCQKFWWPFLVIHSEFRIPPIFTICFISRYFRKIYYFPLFRKFSIYPSISENSPHFVSFTCFCLLYVFFISPYFDHDTFMHHILHVLDASGPTQHYCFGDPTVPTIRNIIVYNIITSFASIVITIVSSFVNPASVSLDCSVLTVIIFVYSISSTTFSIISFQSYDLVHIPTEPFCTASDGRGNGQKPPQTKDPLTNHPGQNPANNWQRICTEGFCPCFFVLDLLKIGGVRDVGEGDQNWPKIAWRTLWIDVLYGLMANCGALRGCVCCVCLKTALTFKYCSNDLNFLMQGIF